MDSNISGKNFWNDYSANFDAIYGTQKGWFNGFVNQNFRKCMRMRYEKTIHNISDPSASVLDIGCGPGHYCVALAKKNISFIHGIDFSEKMITLAKSHADTVDTISTLQFDVADFSLFQPTRYSYDYSIMMGFIEYFEKPLPILKKAAELTGRKMFVSFPKDGGLLAFQRKIRYKSRCYLKLYKKKEIEKLFQQLPLTSYSIDLMDRDYFVTGVQ